MDKIHELIGAAVVRLRTDKTLTDDDREHLNQLIELLCARLHEARLGERLALITLGTDNAWH